MVASLSGRRDLNPGPLQPHCSALAKLRHAPCDCYTASSSLCSMCETVFVLT